MQTDGQLIQQARRAFEQGDLAVAERNYRALAESHPEQPEVHIMLGACLQARGDAHAAIDAMERAVDLDGSRGEHWFQLGRICRLNGQVERAEKALNQATRLQPNHALAWTELGMLARDGGDRASAERSFRTALRAQPDCVPALASLAGVLLEAGDTAQAHEQASRAVRLRPTDTLAQLVMARVFQEQGHADFAERCLRNALQRVPAHPGLNRALAELLLSRGQVEESLQFARAAATTDRSSALLEVRAQRQLGQITEARRRLEALAEQHVLDAWPMLLLAELRLADDDLDAARLLLPGLEQDWTEAAGLVRALLAEAEDDANGAADLAAALHHSDDAYLQRQARLLSGRLAAARGDADACRQVLEPLLDGDGDHAYVHWLLATTLDRCGDYAAAASHLAQAAWRKPALLQQREKRFPPGLAARLEALDGSNWNGHPVADDRPDCVFVLGWPGSGREAMLSALTRAGAMQALDVRGGERRMRALDLPARPEVLEGLEQGAIRLVRRRYFRGEAVDAGRVLEPVWFSALDLPALARFFPGSIVIVADADLRDLETDWRLQGFGEIDRLSLLFRQDRTLLTHLAEHLPLQFVKVGRGELKDAPESVARRLCDLLGLDDHLSLARALSEQASELRPEGHWRHYQSPSDDRLRH